MAVSDGGPTWLPAERWTEHGLTAGILAIGPDRLVHVAYRSRFSALGWLIGMPLLVALGVGLRAGFQWDLSHLLASTFPLSLVLLVVSVAQAKADRHARGRVAQGGADVLSIVLGDIDRIRWSGSDLRSGVIVELAMDAGGDHRFFADRAVLDRLQEAVWSAHRRFAPDRDGWWKILPGGP